MGNRPPGRAEGGTIHASLARHRSGRSTKSRRSMRRISLLQSTRVREPIEREPPETLPSNIEHPFELDLMDLKMQRNLCGCVHPLARVDIVVDADDGRRAFIDRRIALHASANDLQIVHQELHIHCYLTRQSILANDDQRPHPHLVTLIGHYEFQQTLHILTEYYPHGSLLSRIIPAEGTSGSKGPAQIHDESDALWAARQICDAVAFMHDEGVAHMDIALDNIFVDATGALRLGDFRHSIYIGKLQRRRHVAPMPVRRAYGAPELYTGREVDLLKADAWSVGIVMVMLLTKQMPLSEATTHDTHYRLLQVLGVPAFLERMIQDTVRHPDSHHPTPVVQDLVKLLTDLLECEPDKRLSITEALKRYPWLALSAPPTNVSAGPASTPEAPAVDDHPLTPGPLDPASVSGPEIESDSAAKATS